jgi:rhamnosyltransferase
LAPAVSVIIRAKDEAVSIGRVLDLLQAQEMDGRDVELIVVDSGSQDDTRQMALERGVRVIDIPPAHFSYGGALNTGCEAASAPILLALSAHAFPRDGRWLARMLEVFEDERVACAYGCDNAPGGGALTERVLQDAQHARRHYTWGYSNVSGAFRAELWRRRRFRTDMPSTEDREWSLYWLDRGWLCVMDPELRVDHAHDMDSLPDAYRRAWREWNGYTRYMQMPRYGAAELAREWWSDRQGWPSHLRARLSPRRIATLLGKFTGLKPSRG